MMESGFKSHNELLEQLNQLKAEKASLEKHVFILNECLSVEELKNKISHLEKKQEMIVSLEVLISRLREEIEPLKYLKEALETKLLFENKPKQSVSSEFDFGSLQMDCYKKLSLSETFQTELKMLPEFSDIVKPSTPTSSNSTSIVNYGSLDEATQLLEQYDVVSDQELLHFVENQMLNHEPISSSLDATNEIPDEGTAMTSTCIDVENTNVQIKNKEGFSTKEKVIMESSENNLVSNDSRNSDDLISQIQKVPELSSEKKTGSIKTINNESTEQPNSSNVCKSLNFFISNESVNSFNNMNLKIDILRGIYSLGFVNPTAIQQRVIIECVNGRDVIVFTGPGTGRTIMFAIPLLQRLRTNLSACQALILVPTRDLAVHIQKIIMSVGDFLGVNICVGGDNIPKKLSVVPHVVVGTPNGIFNMIECKSLNTRCIQTVVLNKADKMLSSNYPKLIEGIMAKLEKNKQVTVVTSDKLDHVLDLYMDTLRDPLVIINEHDEEEENFKNLPKQFYVNTQEEWKMNALCEIHETFKTQRTIVFCNSLDKAKKLCTLLQRLEYAVSLFHLEMNAREREIVLEKFSSDMLRMLITTDPIKGNQLQGAAWIINYDLPINPICYLNRVTKCAENLKVLNLINENDDHTKSTIETHNNSYMIQMPLNIIDLLQY